MEPEAEQARPRRKRGGLLRRLAIWRTLFNARLRNYLLTGILVTAPITITVWISWKILQFFDATARHLVPQGWYPDIAIPGLGLIIVFLGLILVGAMTAGLVGRLFVRTSERITGLDGHQSALINRMRHGDMIAEGQTLYVFECEPAGYACIAANEAEKAANIKVVDYRMIGANGRVYLSGSEADIPNAREAAEMALFNLGAEEVVAA